MITQSAWSTVSMRAVRCRLTGTTPSWLTAEDGVTCTFHDVASTNWRGTASGGWEASAALLVLEPVGGSGGAAKPVRPVASWGTSSWPGGFLPSYLLNRRAKTV